MRLELGAGLMFGGRADVVIFLSSCSNFLQQGVRIGVEADFV